MVYVGVTPRTERGATDSRRKPCLINALIDCIARRHTHTTFVGSHLPAPPLEPSLTSRGQDFVAAARHLVGIERIHIAVVVEIEPRPIVGLAQPCTKRTAEQGEVRIVHGAVAVAVAV